jgi:hypothetical protein
MARVEIEDVKNIGIDKIHSTTNIDFESINGGYTRLELNTKDAELLYERLKEIFGEAA